VLFLNIVSYAQLREATAPKLPPSSRERAILLLVAVIVVLVVYFGWLYYRDWRMKKNFRRYWQGKARKPLE